MDAFDVDTDLLPDLDGCAQLRRDDHRESQALPRVLQQTLLARRALAEPVEVTYELVVDYQAALHEYRKVDGTRLSVATQVQRLVPVAQFFSWLRREHRINLEPHGRSPDAPA